MSEQEKTDFIFKKIRQGVRASSRRLVKEAIELNKKLVVMRNGKVVLIPAREFKSR